MSAFLPGDRARAVRVKMSSLEAGRLYYVRLCEMTSQGVQALYLIGEAVPWQASRFERVADPAARKWPTCPGYEDSQ